EVEPTLLSQLTVRLAHGVEVDPELHRQAANGWQVAARLNDAVHQQDTDGVHNLSIRRNSGAQIDPDFGLSVHCTYTVYSSVRPKSSHNSPCDYRSRTPLANARGSAMKMRAE